MDGHQRLIGSHHMLAVANRLEEKTFRRFIATNQFDHQIDIGMADDLLHVGGQYALLHLHAAIGGNIQIGNFQQLNGSTQALLNHIRVFLQYPDHPGTNGSEAEQADIDAVLHVPSPFILFTISLMFH